MIRCLPAHLADMIAAGEVVERPASVLKELLENAVDAGATAVTTELRRGGMALIRVTDNGCGIAREELPVAFLRHATSKLRTESELGAIGTLGFRGEALAAIAAVSKVEITSRRHDAAQGARLRLEAGVCGETEECGCPEGTSITVSELFFNTPARMKFMKRDSAEAAAAASVLQSTALAHPRISFKLIRDGTEQIHTPGDGTLLSAIYAALGRDFALSLLPVQGSGGELVVEGFVTQSQKCRGSRAMQYFFINGRPVKSQLLAAAVEEAYHNQMMKGKFPGCVLHLTVPLDTVDVNVHPAKTTVKFLNERMVFDAVYYSVKRVVQAGDGGAAPSRSEPFYRTMTAEEYRAFSQKKPPPPAAASEMYRQKGAPVSAAYRPQGGVQPAPLSRPARPAPQERPAPQRTPPHKAELPPPASAQARETAECVSPPREERAKQAEPEMREERLFADAPRPWRIAGEIFKTYIIAEDAERSIYLIDKHAAHERMNFDRLKASAAPIQGQQLLQSETVRLKEEEYEALREQIDLLRGFGFETEDFGDRTLVCRACPPGIEPGEITSSLEEIAATLLRTGRADPESARDALLRTMACKMSVRAGMDNDETELRVLVERVQSGEIAFCPHGRPVKVEISRYELEKLFKRA